MLRRDFMLKLGTVAIAALPVAACTTSATTSTTPAENLSREESRRREIDTKVDAALTRVQSTVPGARELIAKANGVLVFPSVLAAGLGVGGEYGEGALRVHNVTHGYYSLAALTFGLQIGAQSKTVVFLMMTEDALNKFRSSHGWAVGADASVAMVKAGANGVLQAAKGPVVAFVVTNEGLMANLTLEGSKITPLKI